MSGIVNVLLCINVHNISGVKCFQRLNTEIFMGALIFFVTVLWIEIYWIGKIEICLLAFSLIFLKPIFKNQKFIVKVNNSQDILGLMVKMSNSQKWLSSVLCFFFFAYFHMQFRLCNSQAWSFFIVETLSTFLNLLCHT